MIRILLADDSAVARRQLEYVLGRDPDLTVVGAAKDGLEVVRDTTRLRPDVIVMDVHMPVLDGYEATRLIMAQDPTPIVMVSASYENGNVGRIFQALQAGALTVVHKPDAPTSPNFAAQARDLVTTVRMMAAIKLTRRPVRPDTVTPMQSAHRSPPPNIAVVAIAASTGGPAALSYILSMLPATFPLPVLIAQHISPGFERSFASWLDTQSPLRVVPAVDGLPLRGGEVLVTAGAGDLGINDEDTVKVTARRHDDGPSPSANQLFRSVSEVFGPRALGIVLTGMGGDGADGLAALHAAGGWVIAQDQTTSTVWGMPERAIRLGAVDEILPLQSIPGALVARCAHSVAARRPRPRVGAQS